MLSPYGKPHTLVIVLLGGGAVVVALWLAWWWAAGLAGLLVLGLLAFFRDPERQVPTMRGQVVAPADGRVSSVHRVEAFEAFAGPAVCIRIFLSVLDVHVNRSPMHGRVVSVTRKPGRFLNALKAEAAEVNESVMLVMHHPTRGHPVAAVKQITGAIARRIVTRVAEGEILQRGQRFGMIKFGSTTELYLPEPERVEVLVSKGRYVWGGETVVAMVAPKPPNGGAEPDSRAESAAARAE